MISYSFFDALLIGQFEVFSFGHTPGLIVVLGCSLGDEFETAGGGTWRCHPEWKLTLNGTTRLGGFEVVSRTKPRVNYKKPGVSNIFIK